MPVTYDSLLMEEPFDAGDRKELGAILGNKSLRRALGEIARIGAARDKISAADLERQEGLNAALKQQGEVLGITLAIESILELGANNDRPKPESESISV